MSEPLPLRRAMERILDGTVRIPGFQRNFVWEPSRAASLIDSIHRGYPVGSVLLWRTRNSLKTERKLGGFELPPPDKDYPVDYVLDGQQRLTSIFAAFQTVLPAPAEDPDLWLPIYYDFTAPEAAQNSQFVALPRDAVVPEAHFPLNTFFDPVKFSAATKELSDERNVEIVRVQQQFVEALIPVETFESEDRASVAIVFERVNRLGVPLDIFQLLTAWTWSDDFDLQENFNSLAEEFEEFGFEEVGSDGDLMLRCCSAILLSDPSPTALVDISGTEVRDQFPLVTASIRRAVDFLRENLHIRSLKLLPYSSQLIPLAAYFSTRVTEAISDSDRKVLLAWFWRSSFSHRYSGNPGRNIRRDVEEAIKLRKGKESRLGDFPVPLDSDFFISNRFAVKNVATKTYILMLAGLGPRSFLSGEKISLDKVLAEPNRSEYHHCFPRAMLAREGMSDAMANALANFAIISRSENRTISDKNPSVYRSLMPANLDEVLASALIPESLFGDDYAFFLGERVQKLNALRKELVAE